MNQAIVSYITLGVTDFATMLNFYRDGLQLDLQKVNDDPAHPFAFFALGGATLAIYPKVLLEHVSGRTGMGQGSGAQSVSLNVDSQETVDEMVDRARRAGAQVTREPYTPPWGGYCGYFTDPEGFMWEIAWHPKF